MDTRKKKKNKAIDKWNRFGKFQSRNTRIKTNKIQNCMQNNKK